VLGTDNWSRTSKNQARQGKACHVPCASGSACVWERALDAINERIFNLTWCDKADQVAAHSTEHIAHTAQRPSDMASGEALGKLTDFRFALANTKPHSGVHTNVAGQQHRCECHSPE